MKNLQGTKTAENLLKAFAGESQARNKYDFFAQTAKEEGYVQIHDFFVKSAENEKAHALVFYNHLLEGFKDQLPVVVQMNADYTINKGEIKSKERNAILKSSQKMLQWRDGKVVMFLLFFYGTETDCSD